MVAFVRVAWPSALRRVQLYSIHSKLLISKRFQHPRCYLDQWCSYSAPQRKSFVSQFIENIKEDFNRSKEMKENLRKFREEAEKFEQSEAVQKARQRYKQIEKETSRSSEHIMEQLESIKGKVKEGLEEVGKSELGKKGREITEEITKSAKMAAKAFAKQSEELEKSTLLRAVTEGVKIVNEKIEEAGPQVYQAPVKLRKRGESSNFSTEARVVEPNKDATEIELHKDSQWYQTWQNFKDNNQYVNKIFDLKMKYDESGNPVVRASRLLTDKVSDLFGGLFQKSELSEVLTEIMKMDPDFDKEKFIKKCETEIIPNILEAMIRGELEILRDWCYEGAYKTLSDDINQDQSMGYHFDSKVLDISNVDVCGGRIKEQGPVLLIWFTSQQILVVKDSNGNVVKGDPDKVLKITYAFELCRDQSELDRSAAWKLLHVHFLGVKELWL